MKIVHVVRQYWPSRGGLEEFVERLAHEQIEAGAQVRIVTLDRLFTDLDKPLPQREIRDGVEIRRIAFRGSTRYPIAPGVLAHVGDADVVHIHAVDFFFDFFALASLFSRRPIVVTTHGGFFHTAAHSRLKRVWFRSVTRLTARRYDAVVACSSSDHAMFETISPRNLRLIENGVDLDKFADASSGEPVKSLVTIGRFSLNKRLDRLLDVLRILVARDPRWRLDIVGFESDWSEARLRQEIAARSLEGHAQLHVGLDTPSVAPLIGRSSLFVSASEYEGFGIALIEALSAGLLPVVHANDAYRAFSSRRGFIHVTDFADAAGAAQAIESAFEELTSWSGAIRDAAIAMSRQFAWPSVAAAYFETYREASLSRRAAVPAEIEKIAPRRRDCSSRAEGPAPVSKGPARLSR